MKKIVMLSMFSNSSSYLDDYFKRVRQFYHELFLERGSLELILLEGDSTDDTYNIIAKYMKDNNFYGCLIKRDHGGPVYGSIEHPERFKQLSKLWNEMLGVVDLSHDYVVIMESDLIWDPKDLMYLIDVCKDIEEPISPMIMDGENSFYDTWAFRADNERFVKTPPFHNVIRYRKGKRLIEVDSVGSCIVLPAEIARAFRTTPTEELVGFCKEIREAGHKIWIDPDITVKHPIKEAAGHARAIDNSRNTSKDQARISSS